MKIKDVNDNLLFDTDSVAGGHNITDVKEAIELAVRAGVDLRGVKLYSARLRGANLKRAKMTGADLRVADLTNADLSDSVLNGANLQMAMLLNADLSGASLVAANLRFAVIKGANTRLARFDDADMTHCDGDEKDTSQGFDTTYVMVKKRDYGGF